MVFYVNVVIFLMMLHMKKKITSIVTYDWNLDEIYTNFQILFWYILHPKNHVSDEMLSRLILR